MATAHSPVPDLQPVILGGDIGAYSLARTFHEAYGVRSIVVSGMSTGLVRHSRILRHIAEPAMDDAAAVVSRLRKVAAAHAGRRLILVGSADWLVRTIIENRAELQEFYAIPYPSLANLDLVTDKDHFGRLCQENGMGHPKTVVHEVPEGEVPDTSHLQFPLIAKTGDTAAYHQVEFAGKKKVFTVDSREELVELMDRVRASGYTSNFVIQDFIPGDDSGMRILTCYSDRNGIMQFASFGHVLLEEHTPGALGNPAGIITQAGSEIVEQARKFLEGIGWTGYANFDLKFDPRDGSTVFFELNPRLGRSNFYITAAGQNTVELYVREYVQGLDPLPPGAAAELTTEHLYTVLPHRLLLKYIADPQLRQRTKKMMRKRQVTNPLWYRAEWDPRRLFYLLLAQFNQFRKYARHYPLAHATEQSKK